MLDLAHKFAAAGCYGSVSAVRLDDGATVEYDADRAHVMASLVKVPIALEFYSRIADGAIDPGRMVTLDSSSSTPGPVGISRFEHPVTVSIGDLAYLMLTISDNAATDVVTEIVGIDQVNGRLARIGCNSTVVVGNLQDTLDGFAVDMGSADYARLLEAQSGRIGMDAKAAATDPGRIDSSRALDPSAASRTTAADATRLLAAVWRDAAGPAEACTKLRSVMAEQVTRRLGSVVSPGGTLAAKSGGLFRRVRNEMGVVTDPDGRQFAVAVLTRTQSSDADPSEVEKAMVAAVEAALKELRAG